MDRCKPMGSYRATKLWETPSEVLDDILLVRSVWTAVGRSRANAASIAQCQALDRPAVARTAAQRGPVGFIAGPYGLDLGSCSWTAQTWDPHSLSLRILFIFWACTVEVE